MISPAAILPLASASGAVEMRAEPLLEGIPWLSNSTLVAVVVAALILLLARRATRRMTLVPRAGVQNAFEALVEMLHVALEGIVGRHMVGRALPLLATIFIFILSSNWFGLLPGVGTIGIGEKIGFLSLKEVDVPLLRPPNADLNMTLAMAAFFMVIWFWWTMREVGPVGFLKENFGPKGGLAGAIAIVLLPVFFFVGVIEMVSIAFRPVSLSLRLFGNIYAGETLLHTMATLGDALPPPWPMAMAVLAPIPFYFLELLVGLLQALVFTLLCAVYIRLSTSHEEEAH